MRLNKVCWWAARGAVAVIMACAGCDSDGGNNPFASGSGPTSAGASASASASATATDDGSGSGSGGGSESSTSDDNPTSGTTDPATTSPSTDTATSTTNATATATMTDTAESDSTGGMPTTDMPTDDTMGGGMGQPMDGMYSACTVAMDCGFVPTLCITINDMDGAVLDGFCSETGCSNPAVDCNPNPGGTATPTCMPVNINGMDDMACALNCGGGLTCPAGMTCYPLASGSVCG